MNAKEILSKVKAIFEAPVVPAAPVVEEPAAPMGVDCPLEDGRVMTCTPAMEAGASAMIDGQPAPAGEYKMADGSTAIVGEDGVIAEVKPVEPVTTEVPEAPEVTMEARIASLEAKIAQLEAVSDGGKYASKEDFSSAQSELTEAKAEIEKQNETIKGLFELCEKLAETPTAEPQTLTGNKKEKFELLNAKEKRIEGVAAAITQLKNKK